MFLAWLGALFCFYQMVTKVNGVRQSPASFAIAIAAGVGLTLLIACVHRHSKSQRLWQATRHEPIRRRSWLRWLGVGRAQTCPYCKDDLGAHLSECPGCAACYHPECAEELQSCATLGCTSLGIRAPRASAKPTKVRLSDPRLTS